MRNMCYEAENLQNIVQKVAENVLTFHDTKKKDMINKFNNINLN